MNCGILGYDSLVVKGPALCYLSKLRTGVDLSPVIGFR